MMHTEKEHKEVEKVESMCKCSLNILFFFVKIPTQKSLSGNFLAHQFVCFEVLKIVCDDLAIFKCLRKPPEGNFQNSFEQNKARF